MLNIIINRYKESYIIEKDKDYVIDFLNYLNSIKPIEIIRDIKSIIIDKYYKRMIVIKINNVYIKWIFDIDLCFTNSFITKLHIYYVNTNIIKLLNSNIIEPYYEVSKHAYFKHNNLDDYIINKDNITMYEILTLLNIPFSHINDYRFNILIQLKEINTSNVLINNEISQLYHYNQINSIINIINSIH